MSGFVFCSIFRAFVVALSVELTIRVFKLNKKQDGGTSSLFATAEYDFPKVHKTEIINVGISSTGNFIMSASKDTMLVIWTLKGIMIHILFFLFQYLVLVCVRLGLWVCLCTCVFVLFFLRILLFNSAICLTLKIWTWLHPYEFIFNASFPQNEFLLPLL